VDLAVVHSAIDSLNRFRRSCGARETSIGRNGFISISFAHAKWRGITFNWIGKTAGKRHGIGIRYSLWIEGQGDESSSENELIIFEVLPDYGDFQILDPNGALRVPEA
jgi:hypothetical protein